ncbi:MAG: hypothetical protein HC873_20105 [Leptolyngbyaceae cyanobacterium SL_1_1]|nr:hypothetical protein [Leptolyngbyaceae cyanobacterium SL_1_1]
MECAVIKSPSLVAASFLAITLSSSQAAAAKEAIALGFDLPPAVPHPQSPSSPPKSSAIALPASSSAPLPIPPAAAAPPLSRSFEGLPQSVYQAAADPMAIASDRLAALPPPPSQAPAPIESSIQVAASDGALNFELETSPVLAAAVEVAQAPAPLSLSTSDSQLFQGGTDSLVARAVGSAEGTRTPEGLRTSAFYGHVDPGNGVWNLGTFSYQHGAQSPEEADDKQLQRLQAQSEVIQQKATGYSIELTLAEKLNALDLANQSPRAALSRGGYMDWLAEARKLGMSGSDAILWARTRSFLDPDTQRWNAPGLGNNVSSISRDQERRMRAIARAVEVYEQAAPAEAVALVPEPIKAQIGASSQESKAADFIFSVDLENSPAETPVATAPPETSVLAAETSA